MPKYLRLSYTLSENSPLYGNTPSIKIKAQRRISEGDTANASIIEMHNHSGTHIDAPKHFWDIGRSISDYKIEELIFSTPVVIDCPKSPGEFIEAGDLKDNAKKLKICDIALFRTGFWKLRGSEVYRTANPGLHPEAADYLRSEFVNIRCIGLDSISVSNISHREIGRKSHRTLLQKGEYESEPVLIIEDMDLSSNELAGLRSVFVMPLMLEGIDSSTCTVIGIIQEK